MTHTSLKLSKLLAENGCGFRETKAFMKCDRKYAKDEDGNIDYKLKEVDDYYFGDISIIGSGWCEEVIPAYDILNDLCIKYAKEMFGDTQVLDLHTQYILSTLQLGNQSRAEDYIFEHCKFNPNNK